MEPYQSPLTISKRKKLQLHRDFQIFKSETSQTLIMGDREEIIDIPNEEKRKK
jgi:hypothetical protein